MTPNYDMGKRTAIWKTMLSLWNLNGFLRDGFTAEMHMIS